MKELIKRDRARSSGTAKNARATSRSPQRDSRRDGRRDQLRSPTPASNLVKSRSFSEYVTKNKGKQGYGLINCAAVLFLMLTSFPARPNQTAYNAKLERDPFFRRDDDDVHWMIVDSGCNRHYLCRLYFLWRAVDINVPILCIGDNLVHATKEGLFLGYFRLHYPDSDSSSWAEFSSFRMFVENGAVSLFSISQATMTGENTVVH